MDVEHQLAFEKEIIVDRLATNKQIDIETLVWVSLDYLIPWSDFTLGETVRERHKMIPSGEISRTR